MTNLNSSSCARCLVAVWTLIASLVVHTSSFADDSWTEFRGPSANGIAHAESSVPSEWSREKNIAFRTPLPGQGWSSPVIADGRIYLSAAIPQGEENGANESAPQYALSLIILDANSGELLKSVALMEQTAATSQQVHRKNSHASPTPIVDGNRVFVHFGYQGTACVDSDGNLIWTNRDLFFKPVHGNGGSPILVDDKLIFTCDGASDPKVVALDAQTGKVAWEVQRPNDAKSKFSFCTPSLIIVDGQQQVIAPGSECVLAIDPANGSVIWQLLYSGYSVIPKPIYHDGLVYISTGYETPSMLAIDPTGSGDVTKTHLKWSLKKNVPHTASMIADAGLIYSVSDAGIAICVDAQSGEVIYRERVGGNFSASPILVGNKLYYTSEAGVTTVIATGRQYKVLAKNDLGERTLASAAVDGNALIMRTADAIYRIEE